MLTLATIAFWKSVGLMFYSYALYPVLLRLFSMGKKENQEVYERGDKQLPKVFVVFSAFNEEKVILEKLDCIFNTTYPLDKVKVYVGSDNSSDKTNLIVEDYALRQSALTLVKYQERNGKANVLNKLVNLIKDVDAGRDVLILTDANVMFTPDTIYELVKHFKNEEISQVGANVQNKGVQKEGISFQEKTYIQNENSVKYLEGLNWGTMMGAFGACYALRFRNWVRIPANQLMEDFYLSMYVLASDKKAILEPKAVCYEDVSNEIGEEFKRKTRIQAGNFQNLAAYWKVLFRFDAVTFCFFSHKVLRWLGPVFIVFAFLSNLLLLDEGVLYVFTFWLQCLFLASPVMDYLLRRIGIHLVVLRFAGYFYMMNLALVKGFWMYVRGVKTSAWNPTKRNI